MKDNQDIMRRIVKNKKLRVYLAAAIGIALVVYLLFGSMTGSVVDAETGQPIEGAVVLVEWTIELGYGNTYHKVYKTSEQLTDKHGKFRFYRVLNPVVPSPDITIYKKGYVAWNNNSIFPQRKDRKDFEWKNGYVYKLERFKPEYSYVEHNSFVGSSIHDSLGVEKKHLFMKSYDEGERRERINEDNERLERSGPK